MSYTFTVPAFLIGFCCCASLDLERDLHFGEMVFMDLETGVWTSHYRRGYTSRTSKTKEQACTVVDLGVIAYLDK